ncbi:uncharacterized protein M6B38_376080 [Iris pallida]|uniref:Uncharacterized protein n=1 Tax=Iris pallida TaxID=29817 RepID=A0AAX6GAV5_IRIPA|nr:uncharacterized protein M6B38_376080 [Iris pallida]
MLATSCSWSPTASVLRSSGSRVTLKRRSMLSSHSSAYMIPSVPLKGRGPCFLKLSISPTFM